jgi:cold shock CspA family protein
VWGFSFRRRRFELDPDPEQGICDFWHDEEGWGAVIMPGRPGKGFTHFSQVVGEGYRYLVPGEPVEIVWGGPWGHDGCEWTVRSVRPLNRPLNHEPSGA